LPCKTGRTGAGIFLPFRFAAPSRASVKISYALQPHRPALFCPFLAEAVGLTGVGVQQLLRGPASFSLISAEVFLLSGFVGWVRFFVGYLRASFLFVIAVKVN